MRHRPPRDSDEARIHVPVLWGSPVERCKREILRLFNDGPVEERKFHHEILMQGWPEGDAAKAKSELGIIEGATFFLPDRGRVVMLALPGQLIPEKSFSRAALGTRETLPRSSAFRLGRRRGQGASKY